MEDTICIRCGEISDNRLPLCSPCREDLADFRVMVEYLNSFTGSKEDLLWIISSEISNRESYIINDVNIESDPYNGLLLLIPIEPSSSTTKVKPWLKKKYQHVTDILSEISKLRRAYGIAKQHYGVT